MECRRVLFRSHLRESWDRGLNAIEAEAQARHCRSFAALETAQMDLLLAAVERGDISDSAWDHIDARLFWKWRLLSDIVSAYYTHPSAWSALGFGGPASPRGYVRQIGRASCRERVCQSVSSSGVPVHLKKK